MRQQRTWRTRHTYAAAAHVAQAAYIRNNTTHGAHTIYMWQQRTWHLIGIYSRLDDPAVVYLGSLIWSYAQPDDPVVICLGGLLSLIGNYAQLDNPMVAYLGSPLTTCIINHLCVHHHVFISHMYILVLQRIYRAWDPPCPTSALWLVPDV